MPLSFCIYRLSCWEYTVEPLHLVSSLSASNPALLIKALGKILHASEWIEHALSGISQPKITVVKEHALKDRNNSHSTNALTRCFVGGKEEVKAERTTLGNNFRQSTLV